MTANNNYCKGYILASAQPSSPAPLTPISPSHFLDSHQAKVGEAKADTYAIIPCPCAVSVPPVLSEGCKISKGKRACWTLNYCERHWCGPCKKASRLDKHIEVGKEQESQE